ncbi:DUF1611 domain-containing protein [Candidatus Poribacteria bacterium]|nr:DUF1611 domain-containing protein [Candidatus Poribacteria bacterium]
MIRPFDPTQERMAILAERSFGVLQSKLAAALLRYQRPHIVCVIDSEHAGKDASEIVSVGNGVPVVADLDAAMAMEPTLLTLGITPPGGALPDFWREFIADALSRGLHVMSGLHQFLADDAQFAALARKSGSRIWDVRRPPRDLPIGTQRSREVKARRVLTVGSDCRTGKMITSLELDAGAQRRGWSSAFCATGQNGIMLSGRGIAVDAVVSDFVAGATEEIVLEGAATGADWLFVEGQGSLIHPAYSGVTLGLLHGTLPTDMILCHQPSRSVLARQTVPIPPLTDLVRLYETAAGWLLPSRVVGIALNTFDLSEADAHAAVRRVQDETELSATDPIRFGVDVLLDALEASS